MRIDLFIARRLRLSNNNGNHTKTSIKIATAGVVLSVIIMLITIAVTSGFKHEIINKLIGSESKHTGIAELDLWYFALIYLYRQSLELMLKANIFDLVKSEQDRKDILSVVRHDVGAAFDKIIDLQGIDINSNQNIKWLSDFLQDISKIDRESDMFRYPANKLLETHFTDEIVPMERELRDWREMTGRAMLYISKEADELIEEVREDINFAASNGEYELAEDIMYADLGLEMDYIFELLI